MSTKVEGRGVYFARHRIDGCRVLYAVKSDGNRLEKVIVLRPMVSEEAAAAHLRAQLDRLDPLPSPALALVKPAKDPPDPRMFTSTAWAMARARSVQQQRPIRRLS